VALGRALLFLSDSTECRNGSKNQTPVNDTAEIAVMARIWGFEVQWNGYGNLSITVLIMAFR
jgi:hypothetical protein